LGYPDLRYFESDIRSIAKFSKLQNSYLDSYIDENNQKDKEKVLDIFKNLSKETKKLILNEISSDNAEAENFLINNPLDPKIRKAFRKVFYDLINEVNDLSIVRYAKIGILAKNIFDALNIRFRYLFSLAY
jgi:hypothetical protein